jgi:peptidoglycan/xylan/chitin deacetylase (PgdA/CDA1 family)
MLMVVFLFCCFISLALPGQAQQRTVALTFDDLPLAGNLDGMTPDAKLSESRAVNRKIIAALRRHHAPATAFVNEYKVVDAGHAAEERAVLREWTKHGYDLGNHTYSHADLNKVTSDDFEDEVREGEASVRPLMQQAGKQLEYLRFPFNHTGETAEKHAAVAAFLRERGYGVATCTVENSDWLFARAYRTMLDGQDGQAARRLRNEYLEYTRKELEYFGELGKQIFGREIPQVMLLHANRLNADALDDVLRIFERAGYQFVTLQQAQSDQAYKTPETQFTSYGWMWGYRWAKTLNIKVDGSKEPEVPHWIEITSK